MRDPVTVVGSKMLSSLLHALLPTLYLSNISLDGYPACTYTQRSHCSLPPP